MSILIGLNSDKDWNTTIPLLPIVGFHSNIIIEENDSGMGFHSNIKINTQPQYERKCVGILNGITQEFLQCPVEMLAKNLLKRNPF